MATGDITQAPKPNAGSNQRFDLVDHQLIADAFKAFVDATHRGLAASPVSTAGAPTGELWLGSITANPGALDGLVQVDSSLCVGLDADGGLVLVPDGTALSVAIPDDSSDYQVYLYSAGVSENSQVRRFLPAASPFVEFTQAQNIHVRDTAALFVRAGAVGSVVADDVAGGATRPLLFLGIANNTGGAVTFTPAANRLETVTAPTNLPASSTGDVAGTTFTTGDQATLRGMLNAAMHAIARDRWLGSTSFTPTASNNFGAYDEPPAGIDVAVRKHLDFVTIGEDASSSFGTFDRADYASDDLLVAAAIAALPSTGGTIYIKPGFTLDNFAANVTIPADARVKFQSDSLRTLSRVTFDMSDYHFVCASGGSSGMVEFRDCTWLATSVTADGNIIELHDGVALHIEGCFLAVSTTNVAAPVAAVTVNAATVNLKDITIKNTSMSYSNGSDSGDARYLLDTGVVKADGVLVQDVSAVCTGDLAADHNGAIIDIGNAGRHVRVLDCHFSSVGELSASGITLLHAIRIESLVFTEFDTFNRRIAGCSFRGRTTSGGGVQGALGGISATNVKDLVISECVFEECKNPVTLAINGLYTGGRANAAVRGCTFRGSVAARPDAISLSASATFTGLYIHNNTFEDTDVSLIASNGDLTDVKFTSNMLVDCPFEARTGAGFTVEDLVIDDCTFKTTVEDLQPPIIGSSTSDLGNIRFTNNRVSGYFTTTVEDQAFGLDVRAGSIESLHIRDNRFRDLHSSLTYTGLNPVSDWHVIRTKFTAAGTVVMHGNDFDNINANNVVSGAGVLRSVTLMFVGSFGAVNGDVDSLMFSENTIHDLDSSVSLVHTRQHDEKMVSIINNSFVYGIIHSRGVSDVNCQRATGILNAGSLRIAGNVFTRIGSTLDLIYLPESTGFSFNSVHVTDNRFDSYSGWSTRGLTIDVKSELFVFERNVSITYNFFVDTTSGGAPIGDPGNLMLPDTYPAANNTIIPNNLNCRTEN